MTVRELREKYLRFFESKGHLRHSAGSLIPIDVTGRLDESLLFNGAGMIQFKPYFRGIAQPENRRLTTCQPCVRTNDIDEVGDNTHLSFFEMLGNFSFGDYFKQDAIAFSWEFITSKEWLGLDPKRVSFTVFEEDEEAYAEWSKWIAPTGIDPASRVMKLGEDTNYWPAGAFSNGPPGPCGPNSEMFYWTSDEPAPKGPYTREDWLRDEAEGKWVEFWNDVFIQYEWQGQFKDPANTKLGYQKTGMPELPFRSIDTGMGLERSVLVLSGQKSVYDNEVFQGIFAKIRELKVARPSRSWVSSTVPVLSEREETTETVGDTHDRDGHATKAERVIADHLRTASFCIADGILPGNNGREYVLRRLIRRAVLQGQRVLGFQEPFLHSVFESLVETMGGHYTALVERRELIERTLKNEEEQFRRTLANGLARLQDELEGVEILAGDVAFRLYDTFGFPLEVTQELASEAGKQVDLDGYEKALAEAQARSRAGQDRESVYGGVTAAEEIATPDAPEATTFTGYTSTTGTGTIVRVRELAPGEFSIALDQTPFYGESGGQVGDTGTLTLASGVVLTVTDTTKTTGTFWHRASGAATAAELLGQTVEAVVTSPRRNRIRRNHTATHLLQAALRTVLGTHVTQKGSEVRPDALRFDFTHQAAMTDAEKDQVEALVNAEILANTDVVTYVDIAVDEARAKGAMALFGEKYGSKVRMVEVGDFSRELCGGIHVRTTGEIGQFRIVSESSSQSGVRRIEAVTGEEAYLLAKEDAKRIRDAADLLKSAPKDLVSAVERAQEQVKEERKKREKAEMAALSGGGAQAGTDTVDVKGVTLWRRNFGEVDQKVAAQAVDNEAANKPGQVTLAVVQTGDKLTFIGKAGADAVAKGAHVGNLLREVAKIAGGGGGGRADFATAGGKDPSKADEALAAAEAALAALIK